MRTLALLTLTLLAACTKVPAVADPHHVQVDGRPATQRAFLERYCSGQQLHPTCSAVSQAMLRDATRGTMAKGW
jgi:hypothetical protein